MSIGAVLKLNPARPFGARERWGMHKGWNATVVTSLGQIDAVQFPVINRLTLIDLKRRRGSHLDLADIEAIERLAEL
jgi:hypothetical protein